MNDENPIYGRKVFFVNPSLFIEHFICEQLEDQEYEVYVINDYKVAKPVLAQYKDALCFFGIDSEMSFSEWYNYIKSYSEDESLKTIFIGIISEAAKPVDREKFLYNLKLPGGFVLVNRKSDGLFDNFKGILDLNGAKGRRQYLRLNVSPEVVSGYIARKSRLFGITILNISSVGFACLCRKEDSDIFHEKALIPNVSLTVMRRSMVVDCVVIKILPYEKNPDLMLAVLLFTRDTASEIRIYIKRFIQSVFSAQMEVVEKKVIRDQFSYKQPDVYKNLSTVHPESSFEQNDGDLEDAAELENV